MKPERKDLIVMVLLFSIAIDAAVAVHFLHRLCDKFDMLNSSTLAIEASLAELERRIPEQK